MRLDPKNLRQLPLTMQEQVALALVPPAHEPNPVSGQPKPQRVTVRRLHFVSRDAADRYKALLRLSKSGGVKDIVMRQNENGLIDRFLYITEEVYGNGGNGD